MRVHSSADESNRYELRLDGKQNKQCKTTDCQSGQRHDHPVESVAAQFRFAIHFQFDLQFFEPAGFKRVSRFSRAHLPAGLWRMEKLVTNQQDLPNTQSTDLLLSFDHK